jgi:hypothetical protein
MFRQELARPEGFEPPTPRSVVRFNPESQQTRQKRRAIFVVNEGGSSLPLRVNSGDCGNKDGNNLSWSK